jgi:hypothetical protein
MTACLNESRLQAWIDGELSPEAIAAVRLHLKGCAACAEKADQARMSLALVHDAWQSSLPVLTPASRLRARIEQGLTAQPAPRNGFWWWPLTFPQWQIAGAIVVLIIASAASIAVRLQQNAVPAPQTPAPLPPAEPPPQATVAALQPATESNEDKGAALPERRVQGRVQPPSRPVSKRTQERPTWLQSETNKHLTQMQLLFRSIRNAETETVSEFAYERELSRELLARNRLLRRSAEQKNETREEQLLNQIEPLLLDIANTPEHSAPDEIRLIRERVRDQQIIAELQLYAGKSLF